MELPIPSENWSELEDLTDVPLHMMEAAETELEMQPLPPTLTPHETNPFVHLYRGEMSRLTAYRQRLDTTTNWAISTTSILVTFTLSNAQIPHRFCVFIASLQMVFLWMEARRYINYELVSRRCRLLEAGMYGQLMGNADVLTDWKRQLGHAYGRNPHVYSHALAALMRYRRSHIWISWIIYVAWVFKISLLDSFLWYHLLGASIYMVLLTSFVMLYPLPKWVDV
eukprot:TRINITY_DN8189_c0_g1_i2.p1 TRINITY_DN8189_c0_g1~~TRINITY_DN8189_c0_g1_i2.p1  ORF type:complete len:225 (-),score=29.57 TRINITY_DN8189_c0_g1_i2:2009-2683(-)